MVVTTGIERGNADDLETWKGDLAVGGDLTVTGNLTVSGSLEKTYTIAVPATTWGAGYVGGVKNSGWDIPAGSLVKNVYFLGSAGQAKSIYVGTSDTNPIEFLNGIDMTATGFKTGQPTIATTGTNHDRIFNNDCLIGASLCTFVAGVDAADKTATDGHFIPKSAYFATATRVYFKATTGTSTGAGSIIIVYV